MKYTKLSDIADDISREGVIVSPAATSSRSSDTPEVVSLTGVLGQIIKVFVIIHSENISLLTVSWSFQIFSSPVHLIIRHCSHRLNVFWQPSTVLIVIPGAKC